MSLISAFFFFTIYVVFLHNNVSAKKVVLYELDESDEDYYDDIQHRTRLYDNIIKGQWQEVKNTIAANPEEAATLLVKTKKGRYGTGGQITMKEMALHTLFDQERIRLTTPKTNTTSKTTKNAASSERDPVPAPVALKLINAHPPATHLLNLDNWTPLHLACFANAPVSVLQLLIKHNPAALSKTYTDDLFTPLHCAASYPTAPPDVLTYLMEAEPSMVSKTTDKKQTAFHLALSSANASLDSLKVLAEQLSPKDRRIRQPSTLLHMLLRPSAAGSSSTTKKKVKRAAAPIKVPLEIVQYINSLNTMAVASPDKDGTLPLVAGLETLSLDSSGVEFLLEQNPGAVSYVNPQNKTNPFVSVVALHGALKRYGIDKTSFDLIFKGWPEAAFIANHYGLVALHLAAKTGVTDGDIMMDLIAANPGAVMMEDDKQRDLPIHHVLRWKNKTMVESVVRAMLDVDIGVANVTNAQAELALHVALRHAMGGEYMNQSTSIIDMIIEANPWAVNMKDISMHLPIKLALINDDYLSLQVVESIVRHCDECVKSEDSYRNFPFHIACSYKKPASAAVIKFLYDQFNVIATLPNVEERYPLHLALHSGQDVDVINLLLDFHPKAIGEPDANENFPLHYALLHPKKNYISVIDRIIDAYPEAIQRTNKAKQLPLHTAFAKQADKTTTRKLLALYPESCDKLDEEKMTPLVYALRNEFSESFIEMILDVCPTAAKSDLFEIMVLQIAVVNGYSLDIIKTIVEQDPQSIMRVTDDDRNILTWASYYEKAGGGPGDDHTRAKILEFFLMTAPEAFDGKLWLQVEANEPQIAPFAKGLLKKGRDYWRARAKEEGVVYWKDYPGMREELKRMKKEEDERFMKEQIMQLNLEKMMARKKKMEGEL